MVRKGWADMASTSPITSASDIQMDYMTLLVTQLQNQNPLEPMDNNQMASQLAQFSQLQQLESMNSSFSTVLTGVQRSYASSLIGQTITFAVQNGDGEAEIVSGDVEQVYNDVDDKVILSTGDYLVNLEDVISVK